MVQKMLQIPETYYKNNEDYITIPKIKEFMRQHPEEKFKESQLREELLDSIIAFGNKSAENAEKVLIWIDEAIQEGIKDVNLQSFSLSETTSMTVRNIDKANKFLKSYIDENCQKHICQNQYDKNYKLIEATAVESYFGIKLIFVFCKKLHMHDKKNLRTRVIDYPVMAEYYVDGQWLLVRAKPRSNLYIFNPDGFDIEKAVSTTTEKEIKHIVERTSTILELKKRDSKTASITLKNKVFNLLHKYTYTPADIAEVIDNRKEGIANLSKTIQSICNVEGKCSIPENIILDIDNDINNIVEKYMSINWSTKDIFIKDRDAYPVKLSATDEEESKVEQSAALREPLQTKAIFFDNKKMLYKSKRCDGVVFQWKRINRLPTLKESFSVRISVDEKGNCNFKFPEYTAKEDIENVIFSIIESSFTA